MSFVSKLTKLETRRAAEIRFCETSAQATLNPGSLNFELSAVLVRLTLNFPPTRPTAKSTLDRWWPTRDDSVEISTHL